MLFKGKGRNAMNIKAKEQYWRYSLIFLVLGLGTLLVINLFSLMGGVLGAFAIYTIQRNQMIFLTENKKFQKGTTAMILVVEAILCFLVPLSLMIWFLITKLQNLDMNTEQVINGINNVSQWIHNQTGYELMSKENISYIASLIPDIGQSLMGSINNFIINAMIMVFVLYYMLKGGKNMEQYIYELLPFSEHNKRKIRHEINRIVKSNSLGIPLLAIIQGGVAIAGYYLFNAPYPLLFGLLTCFATIIPIVGTMIVWLPLSIYMAVSGDWGNAIWLAAYGVIVISSSDNLIRFILQKQMADAHPLITVFGVIIGLSLFGFMGIVFGPLLLSMFVLCVDIFKEQYLKDM